MPGDSINIGLLGFGTVGSSVYQLLQERRGQMEKDLSASIELSGALVRNVDGPRATVTPEGFLTSRPGTILDNPQVNVVVEVLGGLDPARDYVGLALARGKHVITANKELVAQEGEVLRALARDSGCHLGFEASVGGSIPVINCLTRWMAGQRIDRIRGIVNGTTNYILSRMMDFGETLSGALGRAREMGYAEADPGRDLSGYDAACKLAILSSLAFGREIRPSQIETEGILEIEQADIESAADLGYTIKLLAVGDRSSDSGFEVMVAPHLIPSAHHLAGVHGADNRIEIWGADSGCLSLAGPGAGGRETASAVLGDLVSIWTGGSPGARTSALPQGVVEPSRGRRSYYLRVAGESWSEALPKVSSVLGDQCVELAEIKGMAEGRRNDLIMMTAPVSDWQIRQALCILKGLRAVRRRIRCFRVLETDTVY